MEALLHCRHLPTERLFVVVARYFEGLMDSVGWHVRHLEGHLDA